MLTQEEISIIEFLYKKLQNKTPANQENYRHYYQKAIIPFLGIHDTAKMRNLSFVLGWAAQSVDMLNERVNFLNFYSSDGEEWLNSLNKTFTVNDFASIESSLQRDCGIVGTTYAQVWYGDQENLEPEIFITAESPLSTVGVLNQRNGLLDLAAQFKKEGKIITATLYTKNEIIWAFKTSNENPWQEDLSNGRIEHGLNQVPLFQVVNNGDTLFPLGRSEITPAVKSIVSEGIRAFGDSSRIRSYFADPIRFIEGMETKTLTDAEGRQITDWSMLANKVINIPYNEDAEHAPQLKELKPSDPNVILETIDRLGKLMAREIGVAPSQIGFETVNPASAEAMNEADKGLILRAQTRIPQYSKAYKQMARFALKLKGVDVTVDEIGGLDTVFKRPSTPTPGAFADYVSKMNAVGVFKEEMPSFIYRGMELSSTEQAELKEWLANKNTNGGVA